MTERDEYPVATRRAVLLGAGALGAAGLLAACGDGTTTPPSIGTTAPPAGGGTTPAPAGTTGAAEGIKTADIPVGGGTIFKEQNIVVTQPTAGTFKAFTATCQHMQCQLGSVADGKITCPCHGSQYNIADGSVARGPTTRGLPAKTVTVSGATLTVS